MRHRYNLEIAGYEDTSLDGPNRVKKSIHNIHFLVAIGSLVTLVFLFGLVYAIDGKLPTPLKIKDEESHPNSFIAERAAHHLKLLTDLGPRVAGSYENEVLTLEFLKREIGFIVQRAHKNQLIEIDVQTVSASHYLPTTPAGKIVAYSNLQNLVVKLHSENSTSSLLVNVHFDSVPTSPGGSDDGINCAALLEIIQKLSREAERPLHNIIFLFNGAEETGLQAAHGFITQHKWAKESKVVLNLEAAGAGGKIILFQSGPATPWIMKYYNRVPHPYGQVAGEELFQRNLIPSDTDFRIFRDYGGLVGLDMAFYKDGYRYHTHHDGFANIPLGSIQHVGDNALSLIRDLSNAPELSDPKKNPAKLVYYDFLGQFMICYSENFGIFLNVATAALSLGIFVASLRSFGIAHHSRTYKFLAKSIFAIIGGWVFSGVVIFGIGFLVDSVGYSMSWYGNPWLLWGLYAAPTVAVSGIFLHWIQYDAVSENIRAQLQAHIVRLIWSFFLILGTLANIRAMYAVMIPVLFNSLAFIIIYFFRHHYNTGRKWQYVYVASLIIPSMFVMGSALTTLDLFVPLSGRIGPDKNPDIIIGAMTMVYTILITSPFVAVSTLIHKSKYVFAFLGAVFVITLIIVFTPLGFPYSGNPLSPRPERHWIIHTRRTIHDQSGNQIKRDAGYFMLNMDRNSPSRIKKHVPEISKAKESTEDCSNFLVCGFPLSHSKMLQIIHLSTWIPAGQPVIPEATKLELISKTNLSPTLIQYNVTISGPDRIGVYLSPKSNVILKEISLLETVPPSDNTIDWNGRKLYILVHISGKEISPINFSFNVEVPENFNEPSVEIGISGIHVHESRNQKMPFYTQFLKSFPEWTDVTAWLGTFDSWWI